MSDLTKELLTELHISPGARGGMEKYRMTLAISLFFKFYTAVLKLLTVKKVPLIYTLIWTAAFIDYGPSVNLNEVKKHHFSHSAQSVTSGIRNSEFILSCSGGLWD